MKIDQQFVQGYFLPHPPEQIPSFRLAIPLIVSKAKSPGGLYRYATHDSVTGFP